MHDKQTLMNADLAACDPLVAGLVSAEERRQHSKIIMIASESLCPQAVREAMASAFTNIYAEGLPSTRLARRDAERAGDVDRQVAFYRRYANRRYYKGCELVDLVETVAQRRACELFATDTMPADDIFANVQPLSGAAANNAVYSALLEPGDVIMGMALSHGGHLTHGSPANRSGQLYQVVSYEADAKSGRLDYDRIADMVKAHNPKLIVAGFSAYPWAVDWAAMRAAADCSDCDHPTGRKGAVLLADIAHTAGLVAAGCYPNPIGYADVVSFTTHKTLCGPRGAVLLSTDKDIARRIDVGVFPREQGGPHIHSIAAKAVCFELAKSDDFRSLQRRTIENAAALADAFSDLGLTLAYGGTDTHLLLVDLKSLAARGAEPLSGEMATRILDLCGIVCNKNTIAGDEDAVHPSGLRFGTTIVTQMGLGPEQMQEIASIVHDALKAMRPFHYVGKTKTLPRAKTTLDAIEAASARVSALLGTDGEPKRTETVLEVVGEKGAYFLDEVCANDVHALEPGQALATALLNADGSVRCQVAVARRDDASTGQRCYWVGGDDPALGAWLRALSDGYVMFDDEDIYAKIDGPVVVRDATARAGSDWSPEPWDGQADLAKPYFVGQRALAMRDAHLPAKPAFEFAPPKGAPKRTLLFDEHRALCNGRKLVPFAGWEMPIYYSSISAERDAVRTAAGLFDVSHMGAIRVSGPGATRFVEAVCTNSAINTRPFTCAYSYVLDATGRAIDDIMIYKFDAQRYMLVVNASNTDEVMAWLKLVQAGEVAIDAAAAWKTVGRGVLVEDLKASDDADALCCGLALQGPASRGILAGLVDADSKRVVDDLRKSAFVEATIAGKPALASRTGYTGEEWGYELYFRRCDVVEAWCALLAAGATPTALGARDATRIEAGFPLFGHELEGHYRVSPTEAGYGAFVKLHKPFFVGRQPYIEHRLDSDMCIVRFRTMGAGRMLRGGDPVVNAKGECEGWVTSCTAIGRDIKVGMAYVKARCSAAGTRLAIFPVPSSARGEVVKPRAELACGDRSVLPERVVVLPRFRGRDDAAWLGEVEESRRHLGPGSRRASALRAPWGGSR